VANIGLAGVDVKPHSVDNSMVNIYQILNSERFLCRLSLDHNRPMGIPWAQSLSRIYKLEYHVQTCAEFKSDSNAK